MVTEKSSFRTSPQFMNRVAVNGDQVLQELGYEQCDRLWVHQFLFSLLWNRIRHFTPLLSPLQRWACLCSVFEWSTVLQPGLQTFTLRYTFPKALLWSDIAIATALVALTLLHSLSVVNHSIKKRVVSAHMLRAAGNMIGFPVLTVARILRRL